MKLVKLTLCLLFSFAAYVQTSFAQANLSVQGTIQKSTGATVDDGDYSLTFKLYTTETGGTAVWSETQPNVSITGGVYSVTLGTVEPLTAAFDQTYYLGITVGSGAELTPRARLTSSPYALSLIGQSNTFPSAGAVGVGTATPTAGNELHVKDETAAANVLVQGATDAQVKVQGAEEAKLVLESTDGAEIEFKKGANSAKITYDGTNINVEGLNLVFDAGINLPANQAISYNGVKDWRLVDIDDFEVDNEGWTHRSHLSASATVGTLVRYEYHTGAVNSGYHLAFTDGQSGHSVMQKLIDLTGIPHTMVKVKFVMHYTGSADGEWYAGGFCPAPMSPYNDCEFAYLRNWSANWGIQGASFNAYSHRGAHFAENMEWTTSHVGNSLVVFMSAQLDENTANESFGIDNVEIYVR